MTQYQLAYYTSGGYKTIGVLNTCYVITRLNSELQLFDEGILIGGVEEIESLFLEQLGYQECITVVDATLVSE